MMTAFASPLSRSSPKALQALLFFSKPLLLRPNPKSVPATFKTTSIFSQMSYTGNTPTPASNAADAGGQIRRFSLSPSSILVIQKGDITKWSVDGTSDAIVNAANERMLGGGGVDGAIHRAAGPELLAACKDIPEVRPGVRCPTGEARITPAFRLPVSHVIHTVGPIYDSDGHPEASLQNAYRNSLSVAKEKSIQYIAFPAISCGVYGYPLKDASRVSIAAIKEFASDFKEFCHFNLRTFHTCSHFSQWILSFKQSRNTHTHPLIQEALISLLHRLQSRGHFIQVHCQFITSGLQLFGMHRKRMLIWNALLQEYSQGSFPEEAFLLFKQMQKLSYNVVLIDSFTFSFLIKACANLVDPMKGVQLHAHTIKAGFEFDVYVQTALINMYSECQFLYKSERIFNSMHQKNVVTWNVMITGLTKWGKVDLARALFNKMPNRTIISWTGMIDGYTRASRSIEAFLLFKLMMVESTRPSSITILSIIPAISNTSVLDIAKSIHAYVEKSYFNNLDIRVNNSLIDMYGKCGCLENAYGIFSVMGEKRNVVSWTSMISTFTSHGMVSDAINLFEAMKTKDIRPNQVTFLIILNACSHGGLVAMGLRFFKEMTKEYNILPGIKHYGCMIDMLGRAGMLDEAEKMLIDLPIEDNVIVWRTLLGACSFHGNAEMGERVMRRILELEKEYGGDYVLLSNIYSGDGRFDDAERVRRSMDERNVPKVPGLSLVDWKSKI